MTLALYTVPDAAGLGALGASFVEVLLRDRPEPVLGLATGSSPLPAYRHLATRGLDLSRVRAFALDEYVGLPAGSEQSYAAVIDREVVRPLGLDPGRVAVPDGGAEDPAQAADAFEHRLEQSGGVDLQLLGIGHNGHLAFNEPGSALDSRTRVECLSETTRRANARFFPSLTEVPRFCITQGLGTIRRARHLLLLVRGKGKAGTLERALTGPVDADCPASILQLHPRVTVIADEAAASGLEGREEILLPAEWDRTIGEHGPAGG
ncbi:glucosamine-6-phosphate deaminase [Arthrobacter zhaoxinii]|uniref:glucosamine-6-phosphate deaminase n=1 Tax=Arthrobacter zhaoxinii TaxID=2964616 RepID=UPI0021056296|nr:glucosamine-6-phosphate deaminase [Arthrobacter zhaoxinii]MCQ2000372.1 glucosamine-6-phosphate deaminase [Arthrobacter zhaoxinii]